MKESASSGKQLSQTYLIVFSLLFPQIITFASESSNVSFKSFIFLVSFLFLIGILEYIGMSTIVNANDFNLSLTNACAIISCMSLSSLICSYFITAAQEYAVVPLSSGVPDGQLFGVPYGHIKAFIFFMILGIILTYLTSSVLVINPYEDEDEINENVPKLFNRNDQFKTLIVAVVLISAAAKAFLLNQ